MRSSTWGGARGVVSLGGGVGAFRSCVSRGGVVEGLWGCFRSSVVGVFLVVVGGVEVLGGESCSSCSRSLSGRRRATEREAVVFVGVVVGVCPGSVVLLRWRAIWLRCGFWRLMMSCRYLTIYGVFGRDLFFLFFVGFGDVCLNFVWLVFRSGTRVVWVT